jgi:hypothetical protein
MATMKIDDTEYDTETMSEVALANLRSIQFVDVEIARYQAHIAALNTARIAYGEALKQALSESDE